MSENSSGPGEVPTNENDDFQSIINSIPQMVLVEENDKLTLRCNRQWCSYTGLPPSKNPLEAVFNAVHPEDIDEMKATWRDCHTRGVEWTYEFRLRRHDGIYRWHLGRRVPDHDVRSKTRRRIITITDIDEQKSTLLTLQETKERYQLIFDSSPLPKWIFDCETLEFIDVNFAAIRHYGFSREEFLSMTLLDIRPSEEIAHFQEAMNQYYSLTEPHLHRNFRHRLKDGTLIDVDVSTHDLILNGRRCRLVTIVDVTDKQRIEKNQQELMNTLHAAKEEAEKASRLKSAFLANMSHEIRTPLGAMMGFADLLRDSSLTCQQRSNYVDILARNGEQLSVIINDILDLSKVEAGHMNLEYSDTDVTQIIADVMSLLRVKAIDKGLLLENEISRDLQATVVTDSTRVRQVLLNLVSNAIKFTQVGGVRINAYLSGNAPQDVCFEISDTGIGIPAPQKDRVFEMFVQADGSMTRRFGGTGLGLTLSRRLARALGGDITILQSEEGRGTTFLFKVKDSPEHRNTPASGPSVSETSLATVAPGSLKGLHILVVDDAFENRQLISTYLAKQGADIEFAENGWECYRKAVQINPDLILMDIQMPVMDGYTATQKLREWGYRKPIVALTAHVMDEVKKKCLAVGCSDHLPKPINSKQLIQTIANLVRGPRSKAVREGQLTAL